MRPVAALLLAALAGCAGWLPASVSAHVSQVAVAGAARVEPVIAGERVDPDFGVRTRAAGLRRVVQMYQWTRTRDAYTRHWRGAPVDASGFAKGHDNPPTFLLRTRGWYADVSLDGVRLGSDILASLDTWESLTPDHAALPANLAVTFQPDGPALTSADNPRAPKVGDLRIAWQALTLRGIRERVVLVDGAWALAQRDASRVRPQSAADPLLPSTRIIAMPRISLLFAALHALLLLVLVAPIVRVRLGRNIGIGDGGDERMSRLIRVQANFIEYVPIALVLLLMLELAGLSTAWLWIFGGALLLARVLHAFGLSRSAGSSPGRAIGALLTFADIAAMACAGLWLALR